MRPRPMPANAKGWEQWPTVDELLKLYPDIKVNAMRALLRNVPCYKADDNTVRYRPEQAQAALTVEEPFDEEGPDQYPADAEPPPREPPPDPAFDAAVTGVPASVLLIVLREQRQSFAVVTHAMREGLRSLGDMVKIMGDPLRQGIVVNREAAERNAAELAAARETHDRMIRTHEELLSRKTERDQHAAESQQRQAFRRDAMELAKTHGVAALQKWSLSKEGDAGLRFARGLDPNVALKAREAGMISDEQWQWLRTVRDDLPADAPVVDDDGAGDSAAAE